MCVEGSLLNEVDNNQILNIGGMHITCLLTPGHTHGHMVYAVRHTGTDSSSSLFTGDCLFLAGVGRNFEGTCTQLQQSIDRLVQNFDDLTLVWPGHEYACVNLAFALSVEADNEQAQDKLEWARVQREERMPTVRQSVW
jgi:hydroxyacylglutathione hydrolase